MNQDPHLQPRITLESLGHGLAPNDPDYLYRPVSLVASYRATESS